MMAGGDGGLLDRAWRIIATGISFVAFGLGGLMLWALAFPLLDLGVRDRARRQRLARRLVQRSFAFHVELMRVLGVLTYEVRGRERLQRDGLLVLANHPTLIDVVFLMSLLPGADCVVKSALARNPFTRGPVRAAGYVCNDDGVALVDDCIEAVRRGGNLLIFPEGTRTRRGEPLKLQRGAANIAVRCQADLRLAHIICQPTTLTKPESWYHIPPHKPHFHVIIREKVAVAPFLRAAPNSALAARQLTNFLTNALMPEEQGLAWERQ